MIEVKNLIKTYGPVVAVDDISFSIRRGEIVGFLGPNGAGKTTTMKILTSGLVADSGTVKLAGIDVLEDPVAVREKIGYLPETVPLYPEMRVEDYLKFIAQSRGLRGTKRRAAVAQTVDVCGLRRMLRRQIGELSKGFRQRVGLAQAMVHRPEILILDEPTMGLDPVQILEIRDVIREAGRDRTVIFSTHILQEVPAVCNRIMVIHEGRLVADGGVDQVCGLAAHRTRLVARIKGPSDQIRARLAELDEAAEVSALLAGETGEYTVRSDQAEALRERVFRLVRDEDWDLEELRLEKATLEEAFVHLTAPPARRSGSGPAKRTAS